MSLLTYCNASQFELDNFSDRLRFYRLQWSENLDTGIDFVISKKNFPRVIYTPLEGEEKEREWKADEGEEKGSKWTEQIIPP